jgi:hypothetical protein
MSSMKTTTNLSNSSMKTEFIKYMKWAGVLGKSATPQGASLKWVGAPRHAEEERGRLARYGDGGPDAETGAEAVTPLPADGEARGTDKMHEGGLLL